MAEILKRDEMGRIVETKLTSEEARRMQRARWEKPKDKNMHDLCELAGYDTPEEMPAHLRLFAEEFASGGPRSVQAGIQFVKAAGLYRQPEPQPQPGRHLNILDLLKDLESPVGKEPTATGDEETG